MQCPVCRVELHMSERSGIEIDYCPQCRGIWLDRGELDKIIERAAIETAQNRAEWMNQAQAAPQPMQPPVQQPPMPQPMPQPMHTPPPYYNKDHRQHSGHYDPHYYKRKKKKGFLEDLFDFD